VLTQVIDEKGGWITQGRCNATGDREQDWMHIVMDLIKCSWVALLTTPGVPTSVQLGLGKFLRPKLGQALPTAHTSL
jgi:hypothetical protein